VSDFWDAIGRAALGRPGTAAPRPRSIFEPEIPNSTIDDLETTTHEVEAPVGTPPPATVSGAPTSALQPEGPSRELTRGARSGAPPEERDSADAVAESPSVERDPQIPSPPMRSAAEPRAPTEREASTVVERRIEVHRFESTQVLTQSISSSEPDESASAAPSAAAESHDVGESPEPDDELEADEKRDAETPLAVLAEPRMVVAEPAPAPPDSAEPPLVIQIDRIDITIEPERVAPILSQRRRDPGTVPSLSDYLGRYGEPLR
jgi:hypothetical protein